VSQERIIELQRNSLNHCEKFEKKQEKAEERRKKKNKKT